MGIKINKNIPDIIDCNLEKYYQILMLFGKNIHDTTSHQIAIQVPISSNVCFSTSRGKWSKKNKKHG